MNNFQACRRAPLSLTVSIGGTIFYYPVPVLYSFLLPVLTDTIPGVASLKEPTRKLLLAACCIALFSFGMAVALTGVSLDRLAEKVGSSANAVGGAYYFFLALSCFIFMFLSGPLMDILGRRVVLVSGSLIMAGASVFLNLAPTFTLACTSMFMMGIGAAFYNSGINTLISELFREHPERYFNLTHACFGIGAVFLPLSAGWLIARFGVTVLLMMIAGFAVLSAFLFLLGRYPRASAEIGSFDFAAAKKSMRNPLLWMFGGMLFCYVGIEATLGNWSRLYLVGRWQIGNPFDQWILSGYWLSLVLGRVLSMTLFRDIPAVSLVKRATAGSVIAVALFLFSPIYEPAVLGLWLAGLFFGPIFPTTIAVAGRHLRENINTTITLVIACSVLGGTTIAPVIGTITPFFGLGGALTISLAVATIMFIIQIRLSKIIGAGASLEILEKAPEVVKAESKLTLTP